MWSSRLLLLLFFVMPSMVMGIDGTRCGNSQPEWGDCETNDQCVLADNECGSLDAFNRKWLAEVLKYNKCIGPMISCVQPDPAINKNTYEAVCLAKKCKIKKIL